MFSQVSVILSTKGGHVWWGHAWQGDMCGGGCAWQGAYVEEYMAGGMHGGGHVWQGGMHSRGHAWQERQSLQWTVRILLKCILISPLFLVNRASDLVT